MTPDPFLLIALTKEGCSTRTFLNTLWRLPAHPTGSADIAGKPRMKEVALPKARS